ncbi:helix-turn-helix transcriptional regulator [Leptobacterium sp. I13]|uniref:helix-turn-helix transcriptional regulator n=1 Tax=Leptobacterium meishanense TaxID=3128904 RepID=UPI0030EEBDC4
MLNKSDFVTRLKYLLDYYDLSAAAFADKVAVQRSSISHILSGRNKPSLEFVLKIITIFPEVSFDWLLLGKDPFPVNDTDSDTNTITTPRFHKEYSQEQEILPETTKIKKKEIQKIVILYHDGSFDEYHN